jgi:two-component system phosphate regulon response regulator OmpR
MTASELRTLIVCDDDLHLREMLSEYFTERGYDVVEAGNADQLSERLAVAAPDAIILDVNMPGTDGLTALRNLRTTSKTPVIMLSAAGDVVDRIVGLEMGADDYVAKPVDLRELEARVKAALRRQAFLRSEPETPDGADGSVAFGPCRLDLEAARLFGPDGQEIMITAMEFSLMRVFARNRGRVLSRDQLLEQAHDRGWEHFDRSIDLRISRLRRKIEKNPTKPETIRTVRGIGYIFD